MPIPNTVYNTTTQLENDLSYNYVITCDLSDSLQKMYLTTKAAYLIHPYSKCGNLVTKFNNEKIIYQYKKPNQCHDCLDISSSHNEIHTQKIIQNQVRVPASMYTMNLAALNTNSDNLTVNNLSRGKFNMSDRLSVHGKKIQNLSSIKANYGVDVKHGSYDRYLNRKKSQNLKTEKLSNAAAIPSKGNKTRPYGLTSCQKNC
jgi:hypothetical protein